jgi:hypothetical protein
MAMKVQAYRARRPKLSPLWQCLDAHFDAFADIYPETYEHDFEFLRPIISEVVGKFMGCGDFAKGFARVRCDTAPTSICYRSRARVDAAQDPPERAETVIEPWLDNPFPDYDNKPVFAEN